MLTLAPVHLVTVEDNSDHYYIGLGLDAGTFRFVDGLAKVLGTQSSAPLRQMTNNIWDLRTTPETDSWKKLRH